MACLGTPVHEARHCVCFALQHSNGQYCNNRHFSPLLVAMCVFTCSGAVHRPVYPIIEQSYRNSKVKWLTRGLCECFRTSLRKESCKLYFSIFINSAQGYYLWVEALMGSLTSALCEGKTLLTEVRCLSTLICSRYRTVYQGYSKEASVEL